jgi:hypothetical protein
MQSCASGASFSVVVGKIKVGGLPTLFAFTFAAGRTKVHLVSIVLDLVFL